MALMSNFGSKAHGEVWDAINRLSEEGIKNGAWWASEEYWTHYGKNIQRFPFTARARLYGS
jgi:hypothetical protein